MASTYMPAYFVILKEDEETITGTVNNAEELQGALEAFERYSMTSFVHWSRYEAEGEQIEKQRLMWTTDDIIPGFIVPCIVTGRCIKRCIYGGKPKTCKRKTSSSRDPDHDYTRSKRSLSHMKGSKKIGCEAKLHIKTMTLYEDYKVPKLTSRFDKELTLLGLKRNFNTATSSSKTVIVLPKPCKHTNHVVTIESGLSHQILPAVQDRICDTTVPQDVSDSETPITVSLVSLSAAQQHFREVLKELTDLSYISTDADLLYAKSKLLEDMVHALKEVVPSQSGLPLHQGTTAERQIGRQLPTRKKRKRLSSNDTEFKQRTMTSKEQIHIECLLGEEGIKDIKFMQ